MTIEEKKSVIKSCRSLYRWFGDNELDIFLFHDKDTDANIVYHAGDICYASKDYGVINIYQKDCETSQILQWLLRNAKITDLNN